MKKNPRSPVYIVSKNRWEVRQTANSLDHMGVDFKMVVEESQFDKYAEKVGEDRLLVLPQRYLDEYDTCDGDNDPERSKGSGGARNFCWDHSISLGHDKHWLMDDNIDGFFRFNNNRKIKVATGAILRAAEDFVDRYENIGQSGLNYEMFVPKDRGHPPYILNTRIYSCLLIRNDVPYRWRGRYNEDTDLSLRMLKDGLCTVLFNAFLANKTATQRMKGGNTEMYKHYGTKVKSEMLKELHPDVTEVVWKFNRWHHHVDYSHFKKNRLIRKKEISIPEGINNYGMVLKKVKQTVEK